ncbi:prepilin-type N-terminal cleavage/methylation domain-containing protein [uncultured Desulfuromonas sp.]|uniref:pilus assembly FimT family protein n=1 Tax=uncultured Desulfuromonas sp. TaxID=181013 RepID=UPI002AAA7FC3|nr:prepilin-type N-terminal cleavage/methylation domain-containing protein [uncultured Desulfuromonas sp.]
MNRTITSQNGFTLVELVVVIVILGILSVTMAPRFFDLGDYQRLAFRDELVSALRYAHKRAVAGSQNVRVVIQADGFSLDYGDAASPVVHPSGGNFVNQNASPVALKPQTVTFNALGQIVEALDEKDGKLEKFAYDGFGITLWGETGCIATQ